jgi:hypothetical protein
MTSTGMDWSILSALEINNLLQIRSSCIRKVGQGKLMLSELAFPFVLFRGVRRRFLAVATGVLSARGFMLQLTACCA